MACSKRVILSGILVGAGCLSAFTNAQQPCNCDAALKKDYATSATTQREKLFYFAEMNAADFAVNKQSGRPSSSFGINIKIPIIGELGAAFDKSDKYEEYKERRQQILDKYGYLEDTYLKTSSTQIHTAPGALPAWVACQQICAPGPFKAYVESDEPKTVRISLVNNTGKSLTVSQKYREGGAVTPGDVALPNARGVLVAKRGASGAVDVDLVAKEHFWDTGFTQTVFSRVADAPKELGFGLVSFQTMGAHEQAGPHRQGTRVLTTNSDGYAPGYPYKVNVTADPGYTLKNPSLGCDDSKSRRQDDKDRICAFRFNESCLYNNVRTEIICTGMTNSRPVELWVEADQSQMVATPSEWQTVRYVTLIPGQTFTFSLPAAATGKKLEYTFGQSDRTLEPGKEDGVLTLDGPAATLGTDVVYNYKVRGM